MCNVEYERKENGDVNLLRAVDRATGNELDCESAMKWSCQDDLKSQLATSSPSTEKVVAKCAVPDDCPKAFARFYQDDETGILPNLGWE